MVVESKLHLNIIIVKVRDKERKKESRKKEIKTEGKKDTSMLIFSFIWVLSADKRSTSFTGDSATHTLALSAASFFLQVFAARTPTNGILHATSAQNSQSRKKWRWKYNTAGIQMIKKSTVFDIQHMAAVTVSVSVLVCWLIALTKIRTPNQIKIVLPRQPTTTSFSLWHLYYLITASHLYMYVLRTLSRTDRGAFLIEVLFLCSLMTQVASASENPCIIQTKGGYDCLDMLCYSAWNYFWTMLFVILSDFGGRIL